MKKVIVSLRKPSDMHIQGVAVRGKVSVKVGDVVSKESALGGGIVSSIELVGSMVEIRKQNEDGTPCRTFGSTSTGPQGNALDFHEGDFAAVPAACLHSFIVREVQDVPVVKPAEPAKAEDLPAAKPAQNTQGQNQQRR